MYIKKRSRSPKATSPPPFQPLPATFLTLMASKRRNSDSENDGEVEVVTEPTNDSQKRMKKKAKKDKNNKKQEDLAASEKPMERKKKRKAMDKERRRSEAAEENDGTTEHEHVKDNSSGDTKSDDFETRGSSIMVKPSTSGGGALPEFHIGVFKDLASADESIREAAVKRLVTELKEVQECYDRVEDKEVFEGGFKLEAEKDDGLDNCAPSVKYAIRRLIRGVSSSRECARQGFALGLTVVIGSIPNIRVESLFKLVVDLLEVTSSMKGQEARDCLLGRLFAYGAVARSGRLAREWSLDKNTSYIRDFMNLLISLAAKKRYLQEPAVSIILDLVDQLPVEALLYHVIEAPGLREWLEAAKETGNPDALLLALKVREKISVDSSMFGGLLPNPFSSSQLFSTDHLSILSNCLKESTFCQPRVHSVWPALINILLPNTISQEEDAASASSSLRKQKKSRKSSSSEDELAKNLRAFCEIIIEGSLLLSSHDRKHLALDVLFLLLQKLSASFLPIVLSNKVVQCLMDILSTNNSWLYKVAQHFLKQLIDWVGDDDVRRVAVIAALQKHSNGKFDSATRTKVVKDLMSHFKTEPGCMLFIQNLLNLFVDEGNAEEEPSDQSQTTDENSEICSFEEKDSPGTTGNFDSLKSWVIESLPNILKYLKLDHEEKLRVQKEVMKFLAVQGLFTASLGTEVTSFELQEKFMWPKTPTSNALCKMCIEQLQMLLANAHKEEGLRTFANSVEPNDLGSYFMRFFSTLQNIPSVSLFRSLDGEDEKAVKNLQEMEAMLSKEERGIGLHADTNRSRALRYLLIQLLLQVLLRSGEYSEAASELVICCKKAFPAFDLPDNSEDEVEVDAEPDFMDVLVDTLLSLLPQSSAPMRSSIEQVFKYFCNAVTDDGLMRMLRVIRKSLKPARHPGGDNEDDDDDEEDDDFIDIEDEENDQDEMGETAESDGQTDDSEAVVAAEETGDDHPEASDDSDDGMDDDAMFRMDTYLAQIFKEKKNQAGGETAHSQLVLFKLRVLSLLEIFLHENPGSPQVLMVYSNLSQAFVNPHTAEVSEQLAQRIWGILQKQIFKAKDYPKGDDIQISTLESLLERNLKLASKPIKRKKSASNPSKQSASWNRQKMVSSLAQTSTFWILKIIDSKKLLEGDLQRVFQIFRDVFTAYIGDKKSQIKSGFLKEILKRRPWVGRHLFVFLVDKCKNAKSDFRRVEALDLITEILKSFSAAKKDGGRNVAQNYLENTFDRLFGLMKELLTKMPSKQGRRAEVRKFCVKYLEVLSTFDLIDSFIRDFYPEDLAILESQLGEQFTKFKKLKKKAKN